MTGIRARVLIVEDEPDTRSNLVDILDMFGFDPVAVGSGEEALSQPDLPNMDVMVLDRRLPDIYAEELLPQLRALAPDACMIIATGYGDLDSTIGALRHGASDYLIKPINPDALRASIDRCLEHKRLERRLRQSERLAAIGKAMAGLAHESRNALQRSQASLDMLSAELVDNEFAIKLIHRIQTAQDDLHRLYEDVREYARPINISPTPSDVAQLLQQTWEELVVDREGRSASLEVTVETDSTECPVESFLIRQVFRNIVDNSLAACEDPVVIQVVFSDQLQNARPALGIRFRDNGPGLPAASCANVFDEFFTTKTHGTGLGLAIVQRTIEAHGGSINLASDVPTGFALDIVLPRVSAQGTSVR